MQVNKIVINLSITYDIDVVVTTPTNNLEF